MAAGGLTYLFTDIEGSTRLIDELGSVYGLALQTQRRILVSCAEANGGQVIRGSEGDGSFFMFGRPAGAIVAAVEAQRRIQLNELGKLALRVRMGVHTGSAVVYGGEHVGLNVHIAARVCAAAYGGQVLCSGSTAKHAEDLPDDIFLKGLGSFVLRGISEPHDLYQVGAADLLEEFPPPRGAVREGGGLVSIWRRADGAPAACDPTKLSFCGPDGGALPLDVHVEVGPASDGRDGAFLLTVFVAGVVHEEFDGVTIGGATDVGAVLDSQSALIRVSA